MAMMAIPLWVSPIIEISGTVFLCLVLFFLFYQINHGRAEFSTGFYVLLTFYLSYILFQILFNYFSARFDMYGWFPQFYLHNHVLARMCILLLSFTAYYMSWANTFLAANRLCSLAMPMLYDSKVWSRRGLWLALFVNHLIPFLYTLIKAPVDADYLYADPENKTLDVVTAKDNTSVFWMGVSIDVTVWIGVTKLLFTSIIEVCVIVAIFRYRRSGLITTMQRNELRLAFFTIFTFSTQTTMFVCNYIQRWAGAAGMDVTVIRSINYWNFDVQSFMPCVAIFCISSHFRQEFLHFYGVRPRQTVVQVSSQTRSS